MFQNGYDNIDEVRLDRVAMIVCKPGLGDGCDIDHRRRLRLKALTELACIDRDSLPEEKQVLYDGYKQFLEQMDL